MRRPGRGGAGVSRDGRRALSEGAPRVVVGLSLLAYDSGAYAGTRRSKHRCGLDPVSSPDILRLAIGAALACGSGGRFGVSCDGYRLGRPRSGQSRTGGMSRGAWGRARGGGRTKPRNIGIRPARRVRRCGDPLRKRGEAEQHRQPDQLAGRARGARRLVVGVVMARACRLDVRWGTRSRVGEGSRAEHEELRARQCQRRQVESWPAMTAGEAH